MNEQRPLNTQALVSAAALGLLLSVGCDEKLKTKTEPSSGLATSAAVVSSSAGQQEKACCMGRNECKGQGGCAVPEGNACAGKNECKGKGGCNMHCPKK